MELTDICGYGMEHNTEKLHPQEQKEGKFPADHTSKPRKAPCLAQSSVTRPHPVGSKAPCLHIACSAQAPFGLVWVRHISGANA